ncbi:MAG: hypothetical protein RLZZ546_2149 [Bacteroidota bacterium]
MGYLKTTKKVQLQIDIITLNSNKNNKKAYITHPIIQ